MAFTSCYGYIYLRSNIALWFFLTNLNCQFISSSADQHKLITFIFIQSCISTILLHKNVAQLQTHIVLTVWTEINSKNVPKVPSCHLCECYIGLSLRGKVINTGMSCKIKPVSALMLAKQKSHCSNNRKVPALDLGQVGTGLVLGQTGIMQNQLLWALNHHQTDNQYWN